MKYKNMNGEAILVPLTEGQTVEVGKIYEIVSEKASKAGETLTGELFGVCKGGDNVEKGMILLDINPTSIFRESYNKGASADKPKIGTIRHGCKLVIAVDTEAGEYEYILRKA